MTVKVTIKLDKAKLATLDEAQKKALELTGEAVKSDIVTSAVVPKNTGELERSAFVDNSKVKSGKISIIFDTPYARRLYWHPEYNFRKDKNVNAQGKWMQSYIDGDKKDMTKENYPKFLKMLSKGLIK
ncbi:minor capsid protein [Clostridium polynesiense]|uniref:minor capsid protein n=1 Tax=Clostridium polynesiense TaxID=1325933 RepID=UPI00058FDD53|nr:minor capsid protein [Clostridium polynesiense]